MFDRRTDETAIAHTIVYDVNERMLEFKDEDGERIVCCGWTHQTFNDFEGRVELRGDYVFFIGRFSVTYVSPTDDRRSLYTDEIVDIRMI